MTHLKKEMPRNSTITSKSCIQYYGLQKTMCVTEKLFTICIFRLQQRKFKSVQ